MLRAALGLAAVLGSLAGLAATATADVPGQVQITARCGSEELELSSGRGGFAAWVGTGPGGAVVLLPVSVSGQVTDASGTTVRTFQQTRPGRYDGSTVECDFSFPMVQDGAELTISGSGEFVRTGRPV